MDTAANDMFKCMTLSLKHQYGVTWDSDATKKVASKRYDLKDATHCDRLGATSPDGYEKFKADNEAALRKRDQSTTANTEDQRILNEKKTKNDIKEEDNRSKELAEKDRKEAEEIAEKKKAKDYADNCAKAGGTITNGKCEFVEGESKSRLSKRFHGSEHKAADQAGQELETVRNQNQPTLQKEQAKLDKRKDFSKKEYNKMMVERTQAKQKIDQNKEIAGQLDTQVGVLKNEKESITQELARLRNQKDNGEQDYLKSDTVRNQNNPVFSRSQVDAKGRDIDAQILAKENELLEKDKQIGDAKTLKDNAQAKIDEGKKQFDAINEQTGLEEKDQSLTRRERKKQSGEKVSEAQGNIDKAARKSEAAAEALAQKEAIKEEHKGSFDGAFGTMSSIASQGVSNILTGALGAAERVGRSNVESTANNQRNGLITNGLLTDNAALAKAENEVRGKARNHLLKKEVSAYSMAGIQGLMGYMHLRSNKVVKARASAAQIELQGEMRRLNAIVTPDTPENLKASEIEIQQARSELAVIRKQLINVDENKGKTMDAQIENAGKMALAMKDTLMLAAGARADRKAIADLKYDPKNTNSNYNIQLNNEAPPPNAVDAPPVVAALDSDQVLNPESDEKAVALDDKQQFNPNDPNFLPEAPKGEGLAPTAPQAPQAAGGSAGGVGGTSAAQDDGSPQAPAKTKDVVGNYASGESGGAPRGAGAKSSGGSGGVGIDQAFADLLKKLLPGEEEGEKKDAGAEQVALGDRAPASDQAAVIGRNQNIFEVIHKRYLKKNQEGAVLYNL